MARETAQVYSELSNEKIPRAWGRGVVSRERAEGTGVALAAARQPALAATVLSSAPLALLRRVRTALCRRPPSALVHDYREVPSHSLLTQIKRCTPTQRARSTHAHTTRRHTKTPPNTRLFCTKEPPPYKCPRPATASLGASGHPSGGSLAQAHSVHPRCRPPITAPYRPHECPTL